MSSGNRFKFEKFTLEIKMGKISMRSPFQVEAAMRRVMFAISNGDRIGPVVDADGQMVGQWGFK